ncbi:MAG: T9SS type A sorting domain-containing protein [Balneolaceae bacterium]
MKKLLVVLLTIFTASNIQAQNNTQETIDRQYVDASHKAFLYQVSPQIRASDEWMLSIKKEYEKAIKANDIAPIISSAEISTDTSWTLSEYRAYDSLIFHANRFTQSFNKGTTNKYSWFNNKYTWYADSARWSPEQLSTTYINEDHGDSSIIYSYGYNQPEPNYGQKSRYPKVPADGANYEYYRDIYYPDTGWNKNSRGLSYRDETGYYDTLTVTYEYSKESEEYIISSKNRYQNQENYYLYSSEYYSKGILYNSSLQEQTPDYTLSEQKYFSNDGEVTSWNRGHAKISAGKTLYQTTKQYNNTLKKLVDKDSLHFQYKNGDKLVEAIKYTWKDSVWVIAEAYNSYSHKHANDKVVVDSVVVFDIIFNAETSTYDIGGVKIKTEMDYDSNANQVEVRNYSIVSDSLQLQSKSIRTFIEIRTGWFAETKVENYGYSVSKGVMYQTGIYENKYNEDKISIGYSSFNLSSDGDTTYGYKVVREFNQGGGSTDIRFDWDNMKKKLVLKSIYTWGLKGVSNSGTTFTQTTSLSLFNTGFQTNRTINVYGGTPGIFNDGPILAEMGDTVSLYVSARNPDFTIPAIEVTNMPTTATYNPETRHFYWIVDEKDPAPMTYKATRGDIVVTTEVEFVTGQIGVGTEAMESPSGFELSQNYPNPFNPTTNIQFTLQQAGTVSLKVFNMLGQEVATLVNGRIGAGVQTVEFDASNLASGVYLYRLQAGNKIQTNKMMLIK